jgi:hypothetical protein
LASAHPDNQLLLGLSATRGRARVDGGEDRDGVEGARMLMRFGKDLLAAGFTGIHLETVTQTTRVSASDAAGA